MDQAELSTIEMMEKYGGSFVKALAEAWRRADMSNKTILEKGFFFYFSEYSEMAKQQKTKDVKYGH